MRFVFPISPQAGGFKVNESDTLHPWSSRSVGRSLVSLNQISHSASPTHVTYHPASATRSSSPSACRTVDAGVMGSKVTYFSRWSWCVSGFHLLLSDRAFLASLSILSLFGAPEATSLVVTTFYAHFVISMRHFHPFRRLHDHHRE